MFIFQRQFCELYFGFPSQFIEDRFLSLRNFKMWQTGGIDFLQKVSAKRIFSYLHCQIHTDSLGFFNLDQQADIYSYIHARNYADTFIKNMINPG